jgi:hypothetical protein
MIKRFRHIPTVNTVVCNLTATAALLSLLAHSRMMRAQRACYRKVRNCRRHRKDIFCSGLTTSSWFLRSLRRFDKIHDDHATLSTKFSYGSAD